MIRVILKSTLVALFAIFVYSSVAASIAPTLGGMVDGNAWLILAIVLPCSAYTFLQKEKLAKALGELETTHAELATTHRKLAEKARRDDMTGMLNRESFFAVLDGTHQHESRGALLIIDADHFKSINDSYGHLTGDKALLEIAAAIRRGVRAGDVLGRIGGEEFAALLSGTTDEEAMQVAERIRKEVEQIRFRPDERTVPLTVSIGGIDCEPGATVSDLMRVADRRLYEAKRRGRNRAVLEPFQAAA